MKTSRQTTIRGVCMIIVALATAIGAFAAGDSVDTETLIQGVVAGMTLALGIGGSGLIKARDHDVISVEAGLEPPLGERFGPSPRRQQPPDKPTAVQGK